MDAKSFFLGALASFTGGLALTLIMNWVNKQEEGVTAHPHGPHACYCPVCGATFVADTGVPCSTLTCPECGSTMRAVETGEFYGY